jgi:YesN/AraC family two-component response regulator
VHFTLAEKSRTIILARGSGIANKSEKGGVKILLVDDEPTHLDQLTKIIEALGFSVIPASDGEEAWEYFKVESPDLVITDIYMPSMNGLELMHNIKEINETCPIILLTGYSHYKNDAIKPDGWITKPIHIKSTVETILRSLKAKDPADCNE